MFHGIKALSLSFLPIYQEARCFNYNDYVSVPAPCSVDYFEIGAKASR
jgi:hypothetical protein